MSELEVSIQKATNENLTADNWQYILDTCDLISKDPESNTKSAIKILKARLSKKDANVLLRTLTLILAAAENCGSRMQQEIASSSFLKENLLEKLADKRMHKELKFRIVEVIEQLHNSLKGDPSLRAIHDAHDIVHKKFKKYIKVTPDIPAKFTLTEQDKKKEDSEFERALKLSAQEFEREQNVRKSYLNSKPLPATQLTNDTPDKSATSNSNSSGLNYHASQDVKTDTATIANVKKVCALYDLISYEPDELSFRRGDIIHVIESVYKDWWRGFLPDGKIGIFPLNYVTPVVAKSPEELSRERKMEKMLIEVESREVDKLFSLLSSDWGCISEEEVTELYNNIIHMKPVAAKMIENHSTRKYELKALNDSLNQNIKIYNDLVEQTITKRNQHSQMTSSFYPPDELPQIYATPDSGRGHLNEQRTSAGFGNENVALAHPQQDSNYSRFTTQYHHSRP